GDPQNRPKDRVDEPKYERCQHVGGDATLDLYARNDLGRQKERDREKSPADEQTPHLTTSPLVPKPSSSAVAHVSHSPLGPVDDGVLADDADRPIRLQHTHADLGYVRHAVLADRHGDLVRVDAFTGGIDDHGSDNEFPGRNAKVEHCTPRLLAVAP